jgi:hypothetical protein
MQTLGDTEIKTWLRDRGLTAILDHSSESSNQLYLQFRAPVAHRHTEAFIRCLLEMTMPCANALIHISDWPLYQPSEMLTIQALRATCGENRRLIDSPWHVIPSTEAELGISLFSLTVSYQWNAWLYLQNGATTLYNWEGELFDFWTTDRETYTKLANLVRDFNLATTTQSESPAAASRNIR